ncbi:hypothetical protein C8039_02270 [Halogeometricum sp. wsp3]|nr:hypothetical protein C8039_02270 [Halogeometricum sp. wsp3]
MHLSKPQDSGPLVHHNQYCATEHLREGDMVILESTVPPGTTEEVLDRPPQRSSTVPRDPAAGISCSGGSRSERRSSARRFRGVPDRTQRGLFED